MIEFKSITIGDKELITSYTLPSQEQDCDLAFANLYSWQFMTDSAYALVGNQLVIRLNHPTEGHEYFLPFGSGNPETIIEELERMANRVGERLCLRGVTPEIQYILEQKYPSEFDYTEERDLFDYIYNRLDLMELHGKNYQPKRNHVNKFHKTYAFTCSPLTPEHIPACLAFEADWCKRHSFNECDMIRNERRALTTAFRHWEELSLSGIVIHIDGQIVAFTFGSPINRNTFGVHYEKADIAIDGSYAAINQLFASQIPEQYEFINREEDLGISGLRQAKLSYHPTLLLPKTRAVKKNKTAIL